MTPLDKIISGDMCSPDDAKFLIGSGADAKASDHHGRALLDPVKTGAERESPRYPGTMFAYEAEE